MGRFETCPYVRESSWTMLIRGWCRARLSRLLAVVAALRDAVP